jgi:hypothetical protein
MEFWLQIIIFFHKNVQIILWLLCSKWWSNRNRMKCKLMIVDSRLMNCFSMINSLCDIFLIKIKLFKVLIEFDLNIFLCRDIQNIFWFSIVDDRQTRLQWKTIKIWLWNQDLMKIWFHDKLSLQQLFFLNFLKWSST